MCIVAVAHQLSPRYPLVVAANRDERHGRPSADAGWWDCPFPLLAGRDLEAGGSWLGVTASGRFAAVTNIFEPGAKAGGRSRGALVKEFLQDSATPSAYAATVASDGARYGPFNLLLRLGDELHLVSNRNTSSALASGVHVVSNNAPGLQWAKVGLLAAAIERAVSHDDPSESLIETLSGPAARGTLERAADSLFVVGANFGTRCTTILTIDASGHAVFVEQRFGPGGTAAGRSDFTFDLTG